MEYQDVYWVGLRFESLVFEDKIDSAHDALRAKLKEAYKQGGIEEVLDHLMPAEPELVSAEEQQQMSEDLAFSMISRLMELANGLDTSDKITAEDAQRKLDKLMKRD